MPEKARHAIAEPEECSDRGDVPRVLVAEAVHTEGVEVGVGDFV